MDPAFKKFLVNLAPKIHLTWLGEVVINKYEPGEGMPEHIDQAIYRYNMVVALNDHGDGLLINGKFHQDNPGHGIIFPMRSDPHEVPPVKTRRYVLIFLYE